MKHNVTLTAHRGYRELYPENTMIAFKKALELDIDSIKRMVDELIDAHGNYLPKYI